MTLTFRVPLRRALLLVGLSLGLATPVAAHAPPHAGIESAGLDRADAPALPDLRLAKKPKPKKQVKRILKKLRKALDDDGGKTKTPAGRRDDAAIQTPDQADR